MWGLTTHVSTPKSNTDCMAALKKNPDTRRFTLSLLRILAILLQNDHAFVRFWITANQSSSVANNTLPKYLKDTTISMVLPKALIALKVSALSSSTNKRCRFHSNTFLNYDVRSCNPFRDHHVTSMLNRRFRVWGRLPSSSITTVYWK